jgi:hypothetical protein
MFLGDRPGSRERTLLGGRVTLEERLNSLLHEARTNGSTECPLCHARMTHARGGRDRDGAACESCGSRLS